MLPNATKQSDTDLRTRDATVPTTPEQQRGGLPAWALEIEHPEGDACREIQAIRRASLSNNRSRMSNSPSVGSPCGVAGAATGSAKRVAVVGRLKTGSVEVRITSCVPISFPLSMSPLEFGSWMPWQEKLPASVASVACWLCFLRCFHSQNKS